MRLHATQRGNARVDQWPQEWKGLPPGQAVERLEAWRLPSLGAGGRRFKSGRPDHTYKTSSSPGLPTGLPTRLHRMVARARSNPVIHPTLNPEFTDEVTRDPLQDVWASTGLATQPSHDVARGSSMKFRPCIEGRSGSAEPWPQRPARLSSGGFLRPALRTGRATLIASGSPRVHVAGAGGPVVGALDHGVGMRAPL